MANINRVTITGNLTRDPELRSLPSGTAVCELGVAVNHRRKDQSDQWVEEPNYFNVVVFGAQGQNCAQYLSKGRPVAVDGRLRWSSWEDKNGGGKRSKVEIVGERVQFLGSRADGGDQGGGGQGGGGQAQGQIRATRASAAPTSPPTPPTSAIPSAPVAAAEAAATTTTSRSRRARRRQARRHRPARGRSAASPTSSSSGGSGPRLPLRRGRAPVPMIQRRS